MDLLNIILFLIFFAAVATMALENGKKIYLIIMFGFLGMLMMFRSVYVGNDTYTYTVLFRQINKTMDLAKYISDSRYESGFIVLCKALGYISKNPQVLFIVTGAFVAFSFARYIYKYSELPWMSVFMFLTLRFYDISLSGLRQITAISILLYAYDCIVEKKFWRFFALVVLASFFHTSCIIFLIMYPLANINKNGKFYMFSIGVAAAMYFGFEYVIKLITLISPGYAKYFTASGNSYSNTPKLAILMMLLLWLSIFIVCKLCERNLSEPETCSFLKHPDVEVIDPKEEYINSVNDVAIWLGILAMVVAFRGTILDRYKYIFSFPVIVHYPNVLSRIKEPYIKWLIIFMSCVVFLLYIVIIYNFRPEWQSSFPYSFFWQFD